MDPSIGARHRKKALVDSSSAIILFKSGLFDRLLHYYQVIISESVFHELTGQGRAGSDEFRDWERGCRIFVETDAGNNHESLRKALIHLGTGERDTILLFYKGIGEMIIIDDGKGAAYCRNNKIPYINALLVARVLHLAGSVLLGECEYFMEKIAECGRYSSKIIEYARACDDESIKLFL